MVGNKLGCSHGAGDQPPSTAGTAATRWSPPSSPARGGAGATRTVRPPSLSAGALRGEARAEATGRATPTPQVCLSSGANTYAGRPHVVVGHRRPSGAKGLYLVTHLCLCETPYADFREFPFHAIG
jgi:hypothetical protein